MRAPVFGMHANSKTQDKAALAARSEELTAANTKAVAASEARAREVATLEEKLTATQTELVQARTVGVQAVATQAESHRQADTQLAALRLQIGALERDVQAAVTRGAIEQARAETALALATQNANAHLEEAAKLRNALAVAEAAPRIPPAELEAARREVTDAQRQLAAAGQELATFRTQAALAARDSEAQTGKLAAAEEKLSGARQELEQKNSALQAAACGQA